MVLGVLQATEKLFTYEESILRVLVDHNAVRQGLQPPVKLFRRGRGKRVRAGLAIGDALGLERVTFHILTLIVHGLL